MLRKPTFNFKDTDAVGLHLVPLRSTIVIEDAGAGLPATIFLIDNVSIVSTTTINTLITTMPGNWIYLDSNEATQTLTDGASITWDISSGKIATLTLAGNRTIVAPSNMVPGSYILVLNQDATGSRTVTWNSIFKWGAGIAPVLSTTANAKDVFSFIYDGTNIYGSYIRGVA